MPRKKKEVAEEVAVEVAPELAPEVVESVPAVEEAPVKEPVEAEVAAEEPLKSESVAVQLKDGSTFIGVAKDINGQAHVLVKKEDGSEFLVHKAADGDWYEI